MTPLIRKEIRLLLPFWALALLLAVLPPLLAPIQGYLEGVEPTIFQAFGFGLIFMCLAPFGQEFSMGMFSSMLAQPIDRRRIWKLKILLVTIAGFLVLVAFAFSVHWRLDANALEVIQRLGGSKHLIPEQVATLNWQRQQFWPACRMALLVLAIAISGGLWATLLFRQMGAALWFIILVPAALYVVVQIVCQSLSGNTSDFVVAAVLSLYSAIGFLWAQRMFAGAQDSQWLGETVALLSLSPTKARAEDATVPRRKAVLRALVRREFQSHQISLIVAFGLLVLHICTLVFRAFYSMPRASEIRFAVEAVPSLWLLVPWLIGCVAIAEERKLNTLEGQLCLPVLHSVQFIVKLAVVLLLGATLGGLMPCLIERLGSSVGIPSEIVKSTSSPGSSIYLATMREMLCAAGIIALISFFASSLTRNTLHALGAAVLVAIASFAAWQWMFYIGYRPGFFVCAWPDLLSILGIPVSIFTVICLSFFNYKTLQVGPGVWFRNLLVLSISLLFIIAVAFLLPEHVPLFW